jgi:hypothetical protein
MAVRLEVQVGGAAQPSMIAVMNSAAAVPAVKPRFMCPQVVARPGRPAAAAVPPLRGPPPCAFTSGRRRRAGCAGLLGAAVATDAGIEPTVQSSLLLALAIASPRKPLPLPATRQRHQLLWLRWRHCVEP